jgi:hypothetical protein
MVSHTTSDPMPSADLSMPSVGFQEAAGRVCSVEQLPTPATGNPWPLLRVEQTARLLTTAYGTTSRPQPLIDRHRGLRSDVARGSHAWLRYKSDVDHTIRVKDHRVGRLGPSYVGGQVTTSAGGDRDVQLGRRSSLSS